MKLYKPEYPKMYFYRNYENNLFLSFLYTDVFIARMYDNLKNVYSMKTMVEDILPKVMMTSTASASGACILREAMLQSHQET